ncbi:MAG: Ku protein [Actinomycetota bacterium]|nr:Ku protein [Actinomycetota bacterium]
MKAEQKRPVWTGAITFGLVNVPVKLYTATSQHDVELHQVHDKDGGRIRYQRRCEVCGELISYEHIDRAFEEDGKTVILSDDDLSSLPAEKSKEIEVVEFVPSEDINAIRLDRSYFLEPAAKSPKAYILLRRTLDATDRTAIVRFSMRQRSRLAALRTFGDALMLQTLLWADEVREADFPALRESVKISKQELDMSALLVASLSTEFDSTRFEDDYHRQLQELIQLKLQDGDALSTPTDEGEETDAGGEVIDLMEALRRSVEQTKATAKKATAKKAPAKKATRKRAS